MRTFSVGGGFEDKGDQKQAAPCKVSLSACDHEVTIHLSEQVTTSAVCSSEQVTSLNVCIFFCGQVVEVDLPPPTQEALKRKPVESLGPLLSTLSQDRYGPAAQPCPPSVHLDSNRE